MKNLFDEEMRVDIKWPLPLAASDAASLTTGAVVHVGGLDGGGTGG